MTPQTQQALREAIKKISRPYWDHETYARECYGDGFHDAIEQVLALLSTEPAAEELLIDQANMRGLVQHLFDTGRVDLAEIELWTNWAPNPKPEPAAGQAQEPICGWPTCGCVQWCEPMLRLRAALPNSPAPQPVPAQDDLAVYDAHGTSLDHQPRAQDGPEPSVERSDPGACWVCTKNAVTPVRVCRKCAALARRAPADQGQRETPSVEALMSTDETIIEIDEDGVATVVPEHRCGVRGFAESGDTCPGCAAERRHP